MKVKYLKLSLLFFVPLLLQQVAWASGENIDDARRIHFSHQPSESRNVVFEDTSLTQLEQRCILQDYQVLIGHLEIEGSRQIGKERQTTLEQKAGNLFPSRVLVHKKGRKKLPDGYENDFGLIATGEGGAEHLVIPRRLSAAYRQAFRLRDENKDAFSRLSKFIQFMNHLESEAMPSMDALLYLHGRAKEYRDKLQEKTAEDFIRDYGKYTYAMPSILTVVKGKGELQNALTTEMPIVDKETGSRIGELPLVYHDERWKIVIIIPDT
ncbi:MAG TPA: hypothetical protein P5169_04315 [Kiritimatiellia bacterium]|jgi:hypothetical protein|nr:hypothetical protein [Lentisphaerota bacterium]HRV30910.1 hypothetical protein [Kiritimatiellia bacterium]